MATQNKNQLSILPSRKIDLISLKSLLTNFHAGYFRISLSLGGQTLLWKTLISSNEAMIRRRFHHFLQPYFPILWSFSFCVLLVLSLIYTLKCLLFFNMVKKEFMHRVGVNYLFAPWISWLLLLQTAPFLASETVLFVTLWWVLVVPVVILDVKIYGQWFTKGKRFLSAVANPTSQLSVIGNLVGAQAAAVMGWRECAVGLFSLGMVHYVVVFVTLYQQLAGTDRVPAMLRPVFFLFFGAPSMACLAWEAIVGGFDAASKMMFFLSLFIFASLVCRPALFKRAMRKFHVAWWAYSFPLTILAVASTEYAKEVNGEITSWLMLLLSVVSILVCFLLLFFTLISTKMILPHNQPIISSSLPTVSPSH